MEGLQEGENEAGGVEQVDQDGDHPAEGQHLRVGVKQEQQVGGDQRHLHVHLDDPEQGKIVKIGNFSKKCILFEVLIKRKVWVVIIKRRIMLTLPNTNFTLIMSPR